jgi:hypothetical protein
MKRFIFLLLYISVSASCSVSKTVIKADGPKKELKGFKLVQTPHAYFSVEKIDLTARKKVKITSTYLFEERKDVHPQITVKFKLLPAMKANMSDAELLYNLDGEIIKIASEGQMADGRFIIPENLWVSLRHAQQIHCSLKSKEVGIDMELNPSERNKLAEFLQLAIEQRDLKFPPIPEGKKKW